MTDRTVHDELGYLQAVVAQIAALVEDDSGVDEAMLRRELRLILSGLLTDYQRYGFEPGVAELVARTRGEQP